MLRTCIGLKVHLPNVSLAQHITYSCVARLLYLLSYLSKYKRKSGLAMRHHILLHFDSIAWLKYSNRVTTFLLLQKFNVCNMWSFYDGHIQWNVYNPVCILKMVSCLLWIFLPLQFTVLPRHKMSYHVYKCKVYICIINQCYFAHSVFTALFSSVAEANITFNSLRIDPELRKLLVSK